MGEQGRGHRDVEGNRQVGGEGDLRREAGECGDALIDGQWNVVYLQNISPLVQ